MKVQKSNLRNYDVAYGSFLFCGLVALLTSVLSYIPMDSGTAGGIGFLVLIPLALASLGAMAVGIVQAIRYYRHWPLIILSVLTLLFLAEIVTEYGSVKFYNMAPIIYGLCVCAICFAWFGFLRKRGDNA